MHTTSQIVQMMAQPLAPDGIGVLEIPEVCSPTISLQMPLQGAVFGPLDMTGRLSSGVGENELNKNGVQVADDQRVVLFDKGSYELTISARTFANYADTPNTFGDAGVYLRAPDGIGQAGIFGVGIGLVHEFQTFKSSFTFSQKGWELRMFSPATLAGNSLEFVTTCYVRQLL